jgi:hypothetical protein
MRLNTPPPITARHTDANGMVTREWVQFYQALYRVLQSPEISGLNMSGTGNKDLYWQDQEDPQVNHLLVDVP